MRGNINLQMSNWIILVSTILTIKYILENLIELCKFNKKIGLTTKKTIKKVIVFFILTVSIVIIIGITFPYFKWRFLNSVSIGNLTLIVAFTQLFFGIIFTLFINRKKYKVK